MIIEEFINLSKITSDIQDHDWGKENVSNNENNNYEVMSLLANRKLA